VLDDGRCERAEHWKLLEAAVEGRSRQTAMSVLIILHRRFVHDSMNV